MVNDDSMRPINTLVPYGISLQKSQTSTIYRVLYLLPSHLFLVSNKNRKKARLQNKIFVLFFFYSVSFSSIGAVKVTNYIFITHMIKTDNVFRF